MVNAGEREPLSRLFEQDKLKDICRGFVGLFGVGVRAFDRNGEKLVDVRASTAEHCSYLFSVHPTRVLCTKQVGEVRNSNLEPGQVQEHHCFSGLKYLVYPLSHENSYLGRLIFGPFAPDDLRKPPKRLHIYQEDGLDLPTLQDHLDRLPRLNAMRARELLQLMRAIMMGLIQAGYRAQLMSQMHIASITGAFEDLERSNRDLLAANKQLEELDRLKSNFVSTVSHELRTPLTSVIGYAEMLLEGIVGDLSEDQREYVDVILRKGESLLTLIAQILDLSRIESGAISLQRTPVDLARLIQESISDVWPQAQKKDIRIDVDFVDEVQPILLDAEKLHRVLTNLLGNAVKFTPNKGAISVIVKNVEAVPVGQKRLDIFEPERNQHLCIEVIDSGVGIPEDKLEQVFESFFQVNNPETRRAGGSGLGLTITKNFVEAHQGKVSVHSKEGKGTTFRVLFPYHPEPILPPTGIDGLSSPNAEATALAAS